MRIYCADPYPWLNGILMKIYCAETGMKFSKLNEWSDKKLKIYCAEMSQLDLIFKYNPPIPRFNILFSFYKTQTITPYLPFMKSLLIDSGAFTLQKRKLSNADFEKYFKKYKGFIEKNEQWDFINGFFELDIPQQIGYDNVKRVREELFECTDKIIPVWHKEYGINEFKEMVNSYDYIGVSCVKNRSIKKQSYSKFVNYAHKHNCKIHGLGMLSKPILNQVPFDSVDGTGWLKSVRYGRYKKNKLNSDYIRKNQYELTYVDLLNHIKMQEHYYNKWRKYHND